VRALQWRPVVAGAAVLLASACGGGAGGGSTSTPGPLPSTDPACVMSESSVPNEGWNHVPEGSNPAYRNNPPASGPHYPVWARYESHTAAVARPYWVHNLEHGAIVLLHRPDAPAAGLAALRDTFRALPNDPACGHPRALLTPDPLLTRPFAAVAADRTLLGDCVNAEAIRQFTLAFRNRGPENVCESGTRP
jgi:uncharacterized protein DUF3105